MEDQAPFEHEIPGLVKPKRDPAEVHQEMLDALHAVKQPLILLGNYIGNEWKGGVGIPAFDRCAIIGQVLDAIDAGEGREP